jgi:hypothetical protein
MDYLTRSYLHRSTCSIYKTCFKSWVRMWLPQHKYIPEDHTHTDGVHDRCDEASCAIGEEVGEPWWRAWWSGLSSREDHFSKTLFTLSRCRIIEDDGSRDLLSQSQVHAGDQDEVDLATQQRRRWRCSWDYGWFLFCLFCMAVVRIYREKPHRVNTFHNWLSFHIKDLLDT